jgi:hypothetical protein
MITCDTDTPSYGGDRKTYEMMTSSVTTRNP